MSIDITERQARALYQLVSRRIDKINRKQDKLGTHQVGKYVALETLATDLEQAREQLYCVAFPSED